VNSSSSRFNKQEIPTAAADWSFGKFHPINYCGLFVRRNTADKKGYRSGGTDGGTLDLGRQCKAKYILHLSELYGVPSTNRFGLNNRVYKYHSERKD
jgi:hypothetical protein